MSIDSELLSILVCPQDRTPLHLAGPSVLLAVNRAIGTRELKNRSGEIVSAPIEEALVRADGAVLYPVREGIPVLLIDESIDVSGLR